MIVYFAHRHGLRIALPILFLWAFSKPVSFWLNRPPRPLHQNVTRRTSDSCGAPRCTSGATSRPSATQEHNWLIPDNVQEEPARIAARISPTNLGFLFNARQVACEFGYLTVPAVRRADAAHAGHGCASAKASRPSVQLVRHAHAGAGPARVSSRQWTAAIWPASLITLKGGCSDLLQRPLLNPALLDGYADHLCALAEMNVISKRVARSFEAQTETSWLDRLLSPVELPAPSRVVLARMRVGSPQQTRDLIGTGAAERQRLHALAAARIRAVAQRSGTRSAVRLRCDSAGALAGMHRAARRSWKLPSPGDGTAGPCASCCCCNFRRRASTALRLIEQLRSIAAQCEQLVREMDFAFLLDRRRKLLSIGYDAETGKVHAACYDLLASEARIAAFIAVAKDDIPQESWFLLSRSHVVVMAVRC